MKGIRLNNKLWAWYLIAGLGAVATYHHITDLLSQQFSVYQIHMGNEASYVVIFMIAGWLVNKFAVRRWGRFGVKGLILLTVVLLVLTVVFTYVFNYRFF